jgi:hypothetical protein
MVTLFLIYILVCFKLNLPVHWYEWVILAILAFITTAEALFSDEVRYAYNKGVREGLREIKEEKDNIFSDV